MSRNDVLSVIYTIMTGAPHFQETLHKVVPPDTDEYRWLLFLDEMLRIAGEFEKLDQPKSRIEAA